LRRLCRNTRLLRVVARPKAVNCVVAKAAAEVTRGEVAATMGEVRAGTVTRVTVEGMVEETTEVGVATVREEMAAGMAMTGT